MSSSGCPVAAWVALGSNLGDSARALMAASKRLASLSLQPLRCSSIWETAPVACPPGSPSFLNAVVELVPAADWSAEDLLDELQALERAFGRRPKQVLNEPRPLDLDLIAFGAHQCRSARLILPHPRAVRRRFVLAPLAEIAPGLVLPGQTKSIRQLLAELRTDDVVRRLGPLGDGPGPGSSIS